MAFSFRFTEALIYATEIHSGQYRKSSGIPYISHLLAVCALVIENGGDEDQAIAALLHDAAEDQGGEATLEDIHMRFGDRVAKLVADLSDTFEMPKPPWQARKEAYLTHLPNADPDSWLISLADKVHNVSTILVDYHRIGVDIWNRFKNGRAGTLWYYRSLADIFLNLSPGYLANEFDRIVSELEKLP
jgi:(p)ppGpp synthase/HD superfamily hydrolase